MTTTSLDDISNIAVVATENPVRTTHSCFHCGQTCPDDNFFSGEKFFCCNGCQTVHEILSASGLEEFYRLNARPGIRIGKNKKPEQFAFLDEPAVRECLLDFSDGRTSRVTFQIPAIHCIACVWLLERLYRLNPGIGRSEVNFPRRELSVTFASEKIKLSELVALLASIGYEPTLTLGELEKSKPASGNKRLALQIGLAGFAFGNIMLLSLPVYLGLDTLNGPGFRALAGYLSLVLALPVLIYSAADYWKSALLSVRQRVLTLDVPIALGLAALYGQSAFQIIFHRGEGFLDSLCGLIFFLLCGRAFQQKTHERLAFDRDYKSFFPLSATRRVSKPEVKSSSGMIAAARTEEETVSISKLQVGDRIIIRNRELIPADAILISGEAYIDYSFVTGESEPVKKTAGDHLYAGGQQVGTTIELETVKPVSESYLTSLWNHETFQKNRDSSLDSLTNRYSRRFTVIVIAIAICAAIFWIATGDAGRGIKAFTSVLIVACPCALALAAPFTLGTAQRLLARANIFIKNSLVLERMARVQTVVFDKTGTLTLSGAGAVRFVGHSGRELTSDEEHCVRSLTRHSTHPLAVRIGDALGSTKFPEPVWSFLETPGCGIEGRVRDQEIRLGSRKWLESNGVFVGSTQITAADGSVVHLAIDGNYRGAFVLASQLRPETGQLLQRLGSQHELALLSGDNERERERFRKIFGDDARLKFNQSPLDKLGFIKRLQESNRVVMMVGDGLNDAGALRQSDVGVAVVESIGAFSPASDVILEAGKVARLARVMELARRATRIVRTGFVLSAIYNVVGVSIAAAGILSPLICAVLMPLSSVTVVLFACGATAWMGRQLKFTATGAQP